MKNAVGITQDTKRKSKHTDTKIQEETENNKQGTMHL